jgi:hypothetical protein
VVVVMVMYDNTNLKRVGNTAAATTMPFSVTSKIELLSGLIECY